MSYPYYDPSLSGFQGQVQYASYVPATYIAPAPTVVETRNFVVEPVGFLDPRSSS
jgi:hypothetical protein